MTFSLWLKHFPKHIGKIEALVFVVASIPLTSLLIEYYYSALGFDPLDRIMRVTGLTALTLLLVAIVISPLCQFMTWLFTLFKARYGKRPSDWNWTIPLRRMIGLFTFFYATLHLIIYFWLDQGGDFKSALLDTYDRKFLLVGMAAFILLIPVTVTSTNNIMQRLDKSWRRIHLLVYPIAILSGIHFWMLTKVGLYEPYPYLFAIFLLVGWRVWGAWKKMPSKISDDGMEVPLRESITASEIATSKLSSKL